MKPGVLCLSLLSACSFLSPSDDPIVSDYALTWFCVSPEGCERAEEVMRIDRVTLTDFFYLHFTSTQDASFGVDGQRILSDSLPGQCSRLHFLSLFGYELEPSRLCLTPGGFDVELSIPNQDPTTHSKWVVAARDVSLL